MSISSKVREKYTQPVPTRRMSEAAFGVDGPSSEDDDFIEDDIGRGDDDDEDEEEEEEEERPRKRRKRGAEALIAMEAEEDEDGDDEDDDMLDDEEDGTVTFTTFDGSIFTKLRTWAVLVASFSSLFLLLVSFAFCFTHVLPHRFIII